MAITIVIINLRQKMGQECGWRYIQKRWAENLRILKNTAVESWDWTMGDDGWVLPLEQRVEFSNVAAAVKFFGSLPAEMNWDLKHHEMCRMFGVGVSIVWLQKTFKNCVSLCRIHWLHLCRGVRPPPITSVLDMTLNNLMVRFQQCWSFGECGVPLHCHRSQVHSGPEG